MFTGPSRPHSEDLPGLEVPQTVPTDEEEPGGGGGVVPSICGESSLLFHRKTQISLV